ncbi:hypothetical protein T492DRAFT_1118684 [Pavlovales sp. CCMP2436]|nr:hypothetical protein T492DRAFT_1118684 [Pavlovales sp. CCMP2436]
MRTKSFKAGVRERRSSGVMREQRARHVTPPLRGVMLACALACVLTAATGASSGGGGAPGRYSAVGGADGRAPAAAGSKARAQRPPGPTVLHATTVTAPVGDLSRKVRAALEASDSDFKTDFDPTPPRPLKINLDLLNWRARELSNAATRAEVLEKNAYYASRRDSRQTGQSPANSADAGGRSSARRSGFQSATGPDGGSEEGGVESAAQLRDRALSLYTQATSLDPLDGRAWLALARDASKRQRDAGAAEALLRAGLAHEGQNAHLLQHARLGLMI